MRMTEVANTAGCHDNLIGVIASWLARPYNECETTEPRTALDPDTRTRRTSMSLLELFKPKWRRTNPRVRAKGVRKLKDVSLLVEITRSDASGEVRSAARQSIEVLVRGGLSGSKAAEKKRSPDPREGWDLSGANLEGANLSNADLKTANLSDANLKRADLSGTELGRADLREANLSNANLEGANLNDANLEGADLRSANLKHANLAGADLSDACLLQANLSDGCLTRASLRKGLLKEANLKNAHLDEANLEGANLRDADLTGANLQVWKARTSGTRTLRALIFKVPTSTAPSSMESY
jgi:uncharacterized protein YjbI with pentapeptide repeats